jgi:hypothetical protein
MKKETHHLKINIEQYYVNKTVWNYLHEIPFKILLSIGITYLLVFTKN